MRLVDSRRLPGANILWRRPGAVIDVSAQEDSLPELVALWQRAARERLDAVGWKAEDVRVRLSGDGASLAISAPLDALYAATEVNESAWDEACARFCGEPPVQLEAEVARLRAEIQEESNGALLDLQRAAAQHGVSFLSDDEQASVGLGTGSQTWDVHELPDPGSVDWDAIHDVPTALITGTNGKTTTARLLAAIASAASKTPGMSSTDCVRVGQELLEAGDWSGPGGARRVMRDQRTEVGILETARGGLLRRGLALERCDVAAVLNVSTDHLGEWGIGTLDGLAQGKFVVTSVADVVVLNADDEVVAKRGEQLRQPVVWFSLDADCARIAEHLERGGRACVLEGDELCLRQGNNRSPVLRPAQIPVTLGGAARYNIANALAAVAIANQLGFGIEAIRSGLSSFEGTAHDNPGRANRFELGGVHAIVDFAHNPHGLRAIFSLMDNLPGQRRLVLLGQAGDRDEPSVREMARITWEARPDMIVIKELTEHLRGRELGVTPAIIEDELRKHGAPPERFVHCASELESVRWALNWARPGDLLMLLCHDHRDAVLLWLRQLVQQGWAPGDPLLPDHRSIASELSP